MKNSRAILTLILCILVAVVFLPGCKKDSTSSDEDHELVGTWRCTSISAEGQTLTPSQIGLTWTVTFRNDDTFSMTFIIGGETESGSGTWSVSGSRVTIDDGEDPFSFNYSMSENKFTFLYPDFELDDGVYADTTFEFTKQ